MMTPITLITLLTGVSAASDWHFDPNDDWTTALFEHLSEEALAQHDAELMSKAGLEHGLSVGEAQALADWLETLIDESTSVERDLYIDAMQASIGGALIRNKMREILAASQAEMFRILDQLTRWLDENKRTPGMLIWIDPGICQLPGLEMMEMCYGGAESASLWSGSGSDPWMVTITSIEDDIAGGSWSYSDLWSGTDTSSGATTDTSSTTEASGLCPAIESAEDWLEGACGCQTTYWTDDDGDGQHDDGEVGFCPTSCVPTGPIIHGLEGLDTSQLQGWMPMEGIDAMRAMMAPAGELAAASGAPVALILTTNSLKQLAIELSPDGGSQSVACGAAVDVAQFGATDHLQALAAGEAVDVPMDVAAELATAAAIELGLE